MCSSKKQLAVIALGAVSVLTTTARAAEPDDARVEDLRRQIAQLQTRLDTFEKQQQQQQPSGSDDVARTVDAIVNDAYARSQLLQTTAAEVQAGYDKGFFIRSDDGNFLLKPGVNFQFRSITNYDSATDDLQNGFEVRRIRPYVSGNAFTPKLTYLFQWDTSRTDGSLSLLDAYVQYRFDDEWAVKVGQFKESVFHEKDVSIFAQLLVDRSLVDALIGGNITDRVQGISLIYGGTDTSDLRIEGTFSDGAHSENTNFQDPPTNPYDFGFAGRVEYKLFGNWADYSKEFTARSTKENVLVVGAGGDFSQDGDTNQALFVLDALYKISGRWSIFGALNGRTLDNGTDDSFTWSALGQVGYAIDQRWEPFARYDVISFDDPGAGREVFNELAVGVNYYLGDNGSAGQRAKLSLDFLWLPDGAPSDQTGIGVLASDDAEYVLRAQFQLML
ncbi:MAG: hypothetical protein QOF78_52 [Phycisphaerales bacterium]|jgi:hypothetical protein|nr:hypothetical protein [Phycisphaerales bacterium]